MPLGQHRACTIIDQQEIGADGYREDDSCSLTRVQCLKGRILGTNEWRGSNFEPLRRLLHPGSHIRRRCLAGQFVAHLEGNMNFLENTGKPGSRR
jgi:hypothetical protein